MITKVNSLSDNPFTYDISGPSLPKESTDSVINMYTQYSEKFLVHSAYHNESS